VSKQENLGTEITALRSEVQALRAEVQALKDGEAVKQLRWAYVQAINAGRFSEGSSYFAEDCSYDIGVTGNFTTRKEVERFFSEIMPFASSYTMDLLANPVVEVAGDIAHGRYFLFSPFTTPAGKAAWAIGLIEDEYVREQGQWKIKKGKVIYHHVVSYHKGWGTKPERVPGEGNAPE